MRDVAERLSDVTRARSDNGVGLMMAAPSVTNENCLNRSSAARKMARPFPGVICFFSWPIERVAGFTARSMGGGEAAQLPRAGATGSLPKSTGGKASLPAPFAKGPQSDARLDAPRVLSTT